MSDPGPVVTQGDCNRDADCADDERCAISIGSQDAAATPQLSLACEVVDRRLGEAGEPCLDAGDCRGRMCSWQGRCLRPCRRVDDCAEGQWCRPVLLHGDDSAFRLQANACVNPFALPPGVMGRWSRTGEGAQSDGDANVLQLAGVEADSSAVWVVEPPCGTLVDAQRLEAELPDGQALELFDVAQLGLVDEPPRNPMQLAAGRTTLMAPAGTRSPRATRRNRLELEGAAVADVAVSHVWGRPQGSTLDLTLFYVGLGAAAQLDGQVPPSLPQWVAAGLAELQSLYAPAGVTLGEVSQVVVGGALGERLTVVDREDNQRSQDFDDLLALSAGKHAPSVNVFFVSLIDNAAALSGAIPGGVGLEGSAVSGIAVGVETLADLPLSLGQILAHEIGHFFGLFHTTEATGLVVEALEDTPFCPLSADRDADGILAAAECSAFDGNNLMFWQAQGGALSAEQAVILRSALVLRP